MSDEEEDDAVQESDITGQPANTSQTQEEVAGVLPASKY